MTMRHVRLFGLTCNSFWNVLTGSSFFNLVRPTFNLVRPTFKGKTFFYFSMGSSLVLPRSQTTIPPPPPPIMEGIDGVSMNIINDDLSSCVMVFVVATTKAFGNGPECAENAPAAGGTGCGTVRVCVYVTMGEVRYHTRDAPGRGGTLHGVSASESRMG